MTQEYTPVAWQDETTSQQGTLINAERLNQMQTAHHFADGLEEVDAVPTADPGVGYHKIVYCTADSTIYRWDGTEWTADIDDETKRLLEQEITRATAAEGELAQDLADETTARETADTAMQADISDLGDAIEAEETARGQADTALGTRITNETSARETADTALGNRITAEATARADADTALGGRIDTEQARAEAAEQANAQAIANTYTKAEIDTALGAKADVATTYSKTETDALLGAKANDSAVVHKAGDETIVGSKTFSTLTNMFAINYERTGGYLEQCKIPTEERGTVPASQVQVQPLTINDKNGQQLYFEQYITGTEGARRYRKNLYTTQGTRVQIEDLWVMPDGTGWRGSPTLPDDAPTNALTTINWVSQTGDAAPNNLLHKNGNETKAGNLTISTQGIDAYPSGWHETTKPGSVGKYTVFAKFRIKGAGHFTVIDVCQNSNTAIALGRFMVHQYSATAADGLWIYRKAKGSNNPLSSDCMYIASDGTDLFLVMKLTSPYGSLQAREWLHINYGGIQDHSNGIEWLSGDNMVIVDDLSGFTNSWQVTE